MGERNIINGFAGTALIADLSNFMIASKWFLILAFLLILVDLRFGVKAAKIRGEKVKKSRAARRTINKIIDYICWIVIAFVIGEAFGKPFDIPLLPILVLLVIYGVEIESIFANYFEYKYEGKKIKVNLMKFFAKKTDIIDIEEDKKGETKT